MNNNDISGGWTEFRTKINPSEIKVFNKVMEGLVGVKYKPLAVATQVVAGTNYEFFCNGKIVRPGASNNAYIVKIYEPLKGDAQLEELRIIRR